MCPTGPPDSPGWLGWLSGDPLLLGEMGVGSGTCSGYQLVGAASQLPALSIGGWYTPRETGRFEPRSGPRWLRWFFALST